MASPDQLGSERGRLPEIELRRILNLTPQMLMVLDADGRISWLNQFALDYFGISLADLRADDSRARIIHPGDLQTYAEDRRSAIARGMPFETEQRLRGKEGNYRWFLIRYNPLKDAEGRVVRWYGAATDIEDRKRAAEALRSNEAYLAEAQRLTHTGSWAHNPLTGRTSFWSDEMFRIFGLDPQGNSSSEKFWQLVHPEDHDRVRARVEREAVEKREYVDEYRIVLADGTIKHILDIGHPVFDDAGDVEFVGTTVDVTERKRAEEELRRSEAYLAESQRLTRTGGWAWSPVTRKTLYWSEEMFRIFGFDPQQGLPPTERFWERVHPEDREPVYELMRKAALEKTKYEHDHRIVLPDGTVKHIHAIGHPRLDDAGEVVEYLGTLIDVTEQKRAEEALRRSEAYLAEAQRLTRTGSFALDPNTLEPRYLSDEVIRMWGYNPEDGLPTRGQLLDRFHPEDRDKAKEVTNKCRLNKADAEDEFRIVLPEGRLKHIHRIIHAVLNTTGEVVELIGTNVDVTEWKQAEENLRSAETRFRISVDHLTDALFIHDDQDEKGRVVDVNQQACDSLGYTREELIGMTAFDYDPSLDVTFNLSVKQRLARGEIFSFESVHRRKDGTTFPVEVRVRPFWHANHRFGLALVRDITDRKRTEQERERLRQLEADLAHLNRVSMMGELAASLTHEIKQPLAAAGMNAKTCLRWLHRQPPDIGEACETVSRILKDVNRANEIIDRNRSLYTRDTPIREMVNLNENIREIIVLLRDKAYQHSISIRAELDAGLPAILADRVQLQQVLLNLMLNGIEAMKDTGGELTITSRVEDGHILLSVNDLGIGLPADGTERIFDAFFTTKAQGTGMGLSICRRIIESHGGDLWASANAIRGATFQFTLPTAPATSSTSEA